VGSGWWLPLEIGSHLICPKNTEIVQIFSWQKIAKFDASW
jgi:hypothetical protein